jgi:hypothetical protein
MNQVARRPDGTWLGSGNPAGKPLGSRQRIAEALLSDLAEVWAEKGKQVLVRLADDDPGKFATIAYGVLPKDVLLRVEDADPSPFADLTPEQKRQIAQRIYAELASENAKVIGPRQIGHLG